MWTRPEDQDVVEILIRHRAAIFGGYLRDVVAGVAPNDIDCVVCETDFEALQEDLLALGYLPISDEVVDEDGTRVYHHPTQLPVEILVVEDSPDEWLLSPLPIPDYDVNLLGYGWDHKTQAYVIYNWMTGEKDVGEIIDHIQARVCHAIIDPDLPEGLQEDLGEEDALEMEPRREKILRKGYVIL